NPADARRQWLSVQRFITDEGDVDAVEGRQKALQYAAQSRDDLWEACQHAATAELFTVMQHDLEAEYVLAFGVYALSVSLPKCSLNTVRSYTGVSSTTSNRGRRFQCQCGRRAVPNSVLTCRTSSRARVRSTIR